MPFHDRIFFRVKAPGLVENRQGNTGLADVVEGSRHAEPLDIRAGEPNVEGKADRHAGHEQAVLKGAFMITANIRQPRGKSVLDDAADHLRRGVIGIPPG